MKTTAVRIFVIVAVGMAAGPGFGPAFAAAEKAACPPEVTRAGAMVARAREALRAAKAPGPRPPASPEGTQVARAPGGDSAAGAGPAPGGTAAPPAARGLATSSGSEVSPWAPRPGDKTLQARTAKARKLAAQARRLCRAGNVAQARVKAAEAIAVLESQ